MAKQTKVLDLESSISIWKKQLAGGRIIRLKITNSDLQPRVQAQDEVEFQEARLLDLKPGQIVLLHTQGVLRVRIIKKRLTDQVGDLFILGAHSRHIADSQYGLEQILAVAVGIIRQGEHLRPCHDCLFYARLRRHLKEYWHKLTRSVNQGAEQLCELLPSRSDPSDPPSELPASPLTRVTQNDTKPSMKEPIDGARKKYL